MSVSRHDAPRPQRQFPEDDAARKLRFAHPSHYAPLVGPSRSRGHGRPRFPERRQPQETPIAPFLLDFIPKGPSVSTHSAVPGRFRRQGSNRRHPWSRSGSISSPRVQPPVPLEPFQADFVAKGPTAGTLSAVPGRFRRQRSSRRHPWSRSRPIPSPRVHPPAPLAPFLPDFVAKGPSASTLSAVPVRFRRQGSNLRHPWSRQGCGIRE